MTLFLFALLSFCMASSLQQYISDRMCILENHMKEKYTEIR